MTNQNISSRIERLYCKNCKMNPEIEIPINMDLISPASENFVRNVRCTICKTIGDVIR